MEPKQITLQYISGGGDELRVTSFGPLAETTIKTFETFQINGSYLQSKSSEVMGLLRQAASQGYASDNVQILQRMKSLCEDLYRELIPVSLHEKLEEAAGGDLLIYMDENLVRLPWELFFDGRSFFCRKYRLGRFVNTPPSNRRVKKRRPQCPVKFLSIADPEGNLPAALEETIRIKESILGMGGVVEPVFLMHKVSTADFLENLGHSDFLHLAAHVSGERKSAVIRFHGGTLSGAQIEQLAGRYLFPSLVFLNGCRASVMEGNGPARDGEQTRAFDLASSFLHCGSRHFIGPLWEIPDAVASQAGTAFFKALFAGRTVGASLNEARDSLLSTFGELSMVWAGYVLYGDPGFRIQGMPGVSDRIFDQIARTEQDRKTCLNNLNQGDQRTRFVAALALLQIGDGSGLPVIEKEFDLIYEFLESPSLSVRRRGERLLQILTGADLGFSSAGDESSRNDAIENLRRWRASDAAKERFRSD